MISGFLLLASYLGCSDDKLPTDKDGDGFAAGQGPGYDCDDNNANVNPNKKETCNNIDDNCDGEIDEGVQIEQYTDADGDSYGDPDSLTLACEGSDEFVTNGIDCDDTNPDTNPYANEVCDEIDNDCDGYVDEDDAIDKATWYEDADGDGYGNLASSIFECFPPSDYVEDATDCDDSDATVNPEAEEVCDEIDNDCDDEIDEDVTTTFYYDGDGDGYGLTDESIDACEQPDGYAWYDGDCDDESVAFYPGAPEDDCTDPNDYNCDGSTGYDDLDADGFAACLDCDDSDAAVNPDADELCDDIDNDCDGTVDEDDALDALTWYLDADGDSFGDSSLPTTACETPSGYVADDTDCDDSDSAINPDADEYCNDIDDDCDSSVDEDDAVDASTWYSDSDSDGFGDATTSYDACSKADLSDTTDATDCDDTNAAVNPDADELCDGIDNDCDSTVDEDDAVDATTWYLDADSDSFGDATSSATACEAPSNHVADATDCDDSDATINPDADELCDGVDNDCDSSVDEDDAIDATTWYLDADSDGYGDSSISDTSCYADTGYVSDATDCDDDNASVYPGADEYCNGIDDDCDSAIDEDDALDTTPWYLDSDSDGYGDASSSTNACEEPSGYTDDDTDCDDTDATVNPGALEYCDGVDNDCDSTVDEDDAEDATLWFQDFDSDGFGNSASFTQACSEPTGYTDNASDCNDLNASINPDADEVCDSVDNDCDSTIDEDDAIDASTWYLDADGDGFGESSSTTTACDEPSGYAGDATDCDDTDADVNPDADEYCNGIDDDCDSTVDEDDAVDASTWYADADSDGFGDPSSTTTACEAPTGYLSDASDCDDGDDTIYPEAEEICFDGVNSDCDEEDDDDYTCTTSTDNASFQISDSTSGSSAGAAVSFVGDTNGDGLADFVVGAYATDGTYTDQGAAYFFEGPLTADITFADANASLAGSENAHYVGHSVNGGGDVNADGLADLLIGGSGYDASSANEGAVYLISGPVSGTTLTPTATLTGADASGMAGWSCSNQGDYNDDGLDDVLIGAPYANSGTGAAYVKQGPVTGSVSLSGAEATLLGEASSDQAGIAVAYAGDVDADGIDDLLVGAHGNDDGGSMAGAVYLVLGPATGSVDLASADAKLIGETTGDFAGYAISDAGDVNADGYDDILTGAYGFGSSNEGAVYGVFGPISGTNSLSSADIIVEGEGSDDRTGISVASAGDVDGDGHLDVAFGAAYSDTSDTDAGLGYLLYGPLTGTISTALINSMITSSYFGRSVDGGEDTDGDGYDDLLWGAPGTTTGRAYLFYGEEDR